MPAENGMNQLDHRDWLILFEKILNEVMEDLAAQGRKDAFHGARVCNSHLILPVHSTYIPLTIDHIHHSPIYFKRRNGVVPRGLYYVKEGISSPDCWYVIGSL